MQARLAKLSDEGTPPNFDTPNHALTPENGWDQVHSRAVIGHEPPGALEPDGDFARAWRSVERYEFSDPRIVRAHFDPRTPLEGRRILLELRAVGLRYLCPVYVADVMRDPQGGLAGFRIDTLKGHIESGSEWFLVEKDLHSGEVHFRIEASWRTGEFPNLVSWLGFLLLGRRYQRAWHRLSHFRLTELVRRLAPMPYDAAAPLVHQGPVLDSAPPVPQVADGARWLPTATALQEEESEDIAQHGLVGAHKQDTQHLRARSRAARLATLGVAALAAAGAVGAAATALVRR